MSDDSVKKHGMPYGRIIEYLVIIILLSALLFVIASTMNLAESLVQYLAKFEPLQLDELLIISIFLVFSLAVLAVRLWHELKQEVQDHKVIEKSLNRANTKLAVLNSITRQDILNQLTELSGDLEHAGQRPDTNKVKTAINKIRRQIKFIKEYQDIGASSPEWQNVADTITRARVGVDLGGVALEVEIRNMEIFADRLLEKAFYYMIDNALKHGGEKLSKIRFYDRKSEDKFVIMCEDDGVGIPADKRGLLFPAEYGRHSGYGLFLVKEILSSTEITIKETGVPGRGARFEIHVPIGLYRRV